MYRGGKEPRTLKTYKEKQKKQPEGNIVKDARNLFIQKKENKAIKDRIQSKITKQRRRLLQTSKGQ